MQLLPSISSTLRTTLFISPFIHQVSTFEFPPSIMYYRADNGSLLFRYGVDVAIVKTLAFVLNFTALFAEPVDGNVTRCNDNCLTGFCVPHAFVGHLQ